MMLMLADSPNILQRYQLSLEKRGLDTSIYKQDAYVLSIGGNGVDLSPLMNYQNDVQAYSWDTQLNVVGARRMSPIGAIGNVYESHDTIHLLVCKLMVLDIPNEKLVQAIQALHHGFQPTYKVLRNYLTDGLMFRMVGDDPEAEDSGVTFEDYIENTLLTLNAAQPQLQTIIGREYNEPVSIKERLAYYRERVAP